MNFRTRLILALILGTLGIAVIPPESGLAGWFGMLILAFVMVADEDKKEE